MNNRLSSFLKYSLPFFTSHPLWTGRSRLLPLLRVLRLQTIYALGEHEVWLPWFDDLVLPLRKGDTGLSGNYYVGLHEFRDMAFALHLLRGGDCFIDVGANLGSYSLIASGLCGAHSIAFEPVPSTYERLSRVINANDLSGLIDARCCALSGPCNSPEITKKEWYFSVDKDCCNSFVDASYSGQKRRIAINCVDEELQGVSPILFKIDVEGFEADVLAGARASLLQEKCLAVIIEGQTELVNQCLISMGFLEIDYKPFRREISVTSRVKSTNKIWIKEASYERVDERIKSAASRDIYGRKI